MKVIHVSTALSWRGGENQVFLLIREQLEAGDKPVLVCASQSAIGLAVQPLGAQLSTYRSRGISGIHTARQIALTSKAVQADFIHVHDSHAHTAAVLAVTLFGCKTKIILHRRVDFPLSNAPLSRWKYNHPSVKAIICVSDAVRMIAARGIQHHSILHTVHDGIDLKPYMEEFIAAPLRDELKLPADAILIGNLAALADHKDYPTFLRAAKRIREINAHAHFIIAGDGSLRETIEKIIAEENMSHYVHLLGFRENAKSILKALDIFLFTSKEEGLGSVLLEAFAAGVTVVATDAGGIPEIVQHEYNGIVVPKTDDRQLAGQVLRLIADPALKNKLSSQALLTVKNFSSAIMASHIKEIYTKASAL